MRTEQHVNLQQVFVEVAWNSRARPLHHYQAECVWRGTSGPAAGQGTGAVELDWLERIHHHAEPVLQSRSWKQNAIKNVKTRIYYGSIIIYYLECKIYQRNCVYYIKNIFNMPLCHVKSHI